MQLTPGAQDQQLLSHHDASQAARIFAALNLPLLLLLGVSLALLTPDAHNSQLQLHQDVSQAALTQDVLSLQQLFLLLQLATLAQQTLGVLNHPDRQH